jgi:ankyrin repeat protein
MGTRAMRPICLGLLVVLAIGIVVYRNRTPGKQAMPQDQAPIVGAIEKGDLEQVRRLVTDNADLVGRPFGSDTPDQPLHYAAWQGKPDIAAYLIDHGADVAARGHRRQTPLHYAARYGHPGVAKLLLDRGADPDAEDEGGFTALFTASRGREPGCTEVAELLERRGAKIGLNDWVCMGRVKETGEVLKGDKEACKKARFPGYLVEDMVGLIQGRLWEKAGFTDHPEPGAASAVLAETLPLLEEMLDQGADPNGGFGSALFYAVQLPTLDVARLLLERGASVERKDGLGLLKVAHRQDMKRLLEKFGAR